MKLPERIYVHLDGDDDDACLISDTSVEDVDNDATEVGIYELKKVTKLQVTKELV